MELPSDYSTSSKRRRLHNKINDVADDEDTNLSGTDKSTVVPVNDEITFNQAFDNFHIHPNERKELISDYKKMMARYQSSGSDIQGFNEIQKTLADLQPMQDVMCLYVRFARQLPSNFHIDSICSLLCLSKQCDYKPYHFLTKVKTLEVRNTPSKYGFSFWFYTRNAKDVDGVLLEKKFLGLKFTLKLLESTITKSQAIFGKVGMRQKGPRHAISTQIEIGHREHVSTTTSATTEFHKHSSLVTKLWLGITHRWLGYHIVDHLFSQSTWKSATQFNMQEIFVYSVQMFAPCGRSRYDYLNPLVGFCLRFQDHIDIDANNKQLEKIRADPSLFHSFGNACLREKTVASKVQLIFETFSNLKKSIQRKSLYRSLPLETQWTLLRAYTFHFWLDQTKNHNIKSSVLQLLSQKKKHPQQMKTLPAFRLQSMDQLPFPLSRLTFEGRHESFQMPSQITIQGSQNCSNRECM